MLRNNGGDNLAVRSNWEFEFGQTCRVTNGSGNVGVANVTNVMVTCAGLYAPIMMACRPTGAPTYTVLAWAPRTEVFTVTNNTGSCVFNQGHVTNGTKWYFDTSWSWGFAGPDDALTLCSCDTAETKPANRLCWHTGNSNLRSGWRCGANTGLSSGTYERVIFQAP